ncbi:MAG: ATP-binding protein [Chitinophagaceae bacterium]|nr:ATP-binding protein [Chitinophagaceae bacterium]
MKKLILFVFAFLYVANLVAQQPVGLPFITTYSPVKTKYLGLATWIIQGRDGVMYFGNWGTNITMESYDGVNWTPLLQNQNLIGHTRAAAIDSSGTIFYGGSGDFGYLSHDSTGETIAVSLLQYVPKDKRKFSDIYSVQAGRNCVYFQSGERIFHLTKTISGKKVTWICKTWDSKKGFGNIFYLDNTLFVQEWFTGLLKLNHDSLQIIPGTDSLKRIPLLEMLPYTGPKGEKEFLLVTYNKGLYLFDGMHTSPFHTDADPILKKGGVNSALMIGRNYVLGTINAGIIILSPQGKVLQVINKQSGLAGNTVGSLYWDGQHNLWAGTGGFGICRIEMNSPFTRFFNQPGIISQIQSMGSLPDGSIYVGSFGVSKYDASTGLFESIPSLSGVGDVSFLRDSNQLILTGSRQQYSLKGVKATLIKAGIKVDAMLISKKNPNLLCAGTFSGGLVVFIRDKFHAGGWRYLGVVPQTRNETIHWIAEQPDGSLWITNDLGSLLTHVTLSIGKNGIPDLEKSKVEEFHAGQAFKNGMRAVSFKDKMYFFGNTPDGTIPTFKISNNGKRFINDTAFLVSGDTVKGFKIGVNNVVWLFSRKGRYSYLTSTETDDRYRIDTSLWTLLNNYGMQSSIPGRNGIIWFSSMGGLIRYDTKVSFNNNIPFNVLIRNVSAGEKKLNPYLSGKEAPVMEYSHHTVRFDFAAPYFLGEDETQYQTRLEGFEKSWSAWSKNPFKEYTNLPFGHYKFEVRARSVLGVISREADYSFTILPPWYRTWWAYIIYAILFGGIVWFITYLRSRKLQKEKLELEEKVNSRTLELKNSLDELKSTQKQLVQSEKMASLGELTAGIAHEIQNPLNFVNNFSDVSNELIDEMNTELDKGDIEEAKAIASDIKQNLEKINHHGRRADAIVKGMLQHSRTSTGQKELTDLNALCDEYLRLAYHGMRAKDKSFNCDMKTEFDSSLPKINVVPQDIGRVILNLINNAFYACAERSRSTADERRNLEGFENLQGLAPYLPTVTVSTKNLGDKVEITVKDNGNGIPEKIKDKIFQPFFTTKPTGQGTGLGLSLSYDIVKAHGGSIRAESLHADQTGTEFIVQLPLKENI